MSLLLLINVDAWMTVFPPYLGRGRNLPGRYIYPLNNASVCVSRLSHYTATRF